VPLQDDLTYLDRDGVINAGIAAVNHAFEPSRLDADPDAAVAVLRMAVERIKDWPPLLSPHLLLPEPYLKYSSLKFQRPGGGAGFQEGPLSGVARGGHFSSRT
jgi:hypothetical protein